MRPKIEIRQLSAFHSIHYPDANMEAGKATFLSGPSGCGKSTLLKLLNGMESPSGGQVLVDGEDTAHIPPVTLRRRVLLASQSVYLIRGSILENFHFFHRYHETQPPTEKRIEKYLAVCGLPFSLDAACHSMSGGERQRVFLAVALSMEPEVLLLDEPTSALDSATAEEVLGNIISHCKSRQITLVIVSHDAGLRDTCADHIIRLEGKT